MFKPNKNNIARLVLALCRKGTCVFLRFQVSCSCTKTHPLTCLVLAEQLGHLVKSLTALDFLHRLHNFRVLLA